MESNMQKMRDALETMNDLFENGVICTSYANLAEEMEQIEELYRKAKSACKAPPRNCDVGTAEEQTERFRRFCKMDYISNDCPDDCPLYRKDYSTVHCPFAWAQMPYKEGDTE